MNADEIVLDHLMERNLGNALTVSNALGAGFLEIVGDYAVDPLVEESVIVELKAIKAIAEIHRPQCINDLRATGL